MHMRNKNITYSLANALGMVLYISGVVWMMNNGDKLFGNPKDVGGPIALLMLFVLSATVTSSLMFGYPIYQFLEGKKIEAFKSFGWNLGFLAIFTVLAFAFIMLVK